MSEENEPLYGQFLAMDSEARITLGRFYAWLQKPEGGGLSPADASPLAHDADRYARDFVVDITAKPLARTDGSTVESYLSNWYIVNTLYPTHVEIDRIASSLSLFHRFLASEGIISEAQLEGAGKVLSDTAPHHARLEEFWNLTPETIGGWKALHDPKNL